MNKLLTVVVDVQITRRKRYHMVIDHRGETVTASGFASDVFDYLASEGHTRYNLKTAGALYHVRMERQVEKKGPK